MMRNLKVLGLAFVAMLAMSVVAASAAQAEPSHLKVTNTAGTEVSAATYTGEQVGAHSFDTSAGELTCKVAKFHGPGTASTVSQLTVTPEYKECHTKPVFGIQFFATVTMNGCDFLFTTAGKDGSGNHLANVDIVCPGTNVIAVHLYDNAAHTQERCTKTIKPQGPLGGNTITNATDGTHWDLLVHHKVVTKVVNDTVSFICGAAEENATYTGTTTLTAEDSNNAKLNLTAITTL